MSLLRSDQLHRTAKIALDQGLVPDVASARGYLEKLVLQIHVGPRINRDAAAQAALLTAVNTGHRAMLGGVHTVIEDDPRLSLPWARGQTLSGAIRRYGGSIVRSLTPDRPILAIGNPTHKIPSEVFLSTLCYGWSGSVTTDPQPASAEAMPLAGVLAGALGVSEVFQHLLGSPTAARRDVGLSLWRPELDWKSAEAVGPSLEFLPSRIWLLGLGHLGQANAWNLGCLPHEEPTELKVFLVDYDSVVEANHATGVLTRPSDIDRLKTRIVADHLEQLGHHTRLIERPFTEDLVLNDGEPLIALTGFDDLEPRRALGNTFGRVVDAGLGAGPTDYLDILIHTFPSQMTPAEAFRDPPTRSRNPTRAYKAEIDHRISQGVDPGDARCGVLELADATPAAAFVGATAGAYAVSDILRFLHGGRQYAVLNIDLRSPSNATHAFTHPPQPEFNPGYTRARSDRVMNTTTMDTTQVGPISADPE